jgi:hypothetical protein
VSNPKFGAFIKQFRQGIEFLEISLLKVGIMKHTLFVVVFMNFLLLAACAPSATSDAKNAAPKTHPLAGVWTLTQTIIESNHPDLAVGFSEVDDLTITVEGDRATITTADGETLLGDVQGKGSITVSRVAQDDLNQIDAFYELILQNGKIVGYRENVYPQGDTFKVVWDLSGVLRE